MKTLREMMNQIDEISRRGFLKGLGAAAGAGVAGSAFGQSNDDIEQMRQANLDRIKKMAGMPTGSNTEPIPKAFRNHPDREKINAQFSRLPYSQKIKYAIKPHIVFNDVVEGNPAAEVEIKCAPDGTILQAKIDKSSGNEGWDRAVLAAVQKTEFLPRDTDGRVPSPMVITFRPKS